MRYSEAITKRIPEQFTLGPGHVKFFYNKLKYLHKRYKMLLKECRRRGFNVTDFNSAFEGLPEELYNDYAETPADRGILLARLKEKDIRAYEIIFS